jgi:hypothetical protein
LRFGFKDWRLESRQNPQAGMPALLPHGSSRPLIQLAQDELKKL